MSLMLIVLVGGMAGCGKSSSKNPNATPDAVTPVGPFSVTSSGSHVTVSPSSAQTVAAGATTSFSVTADAAHTRSPTVGGTCAAGSWSDSTYTTGAITADCTVVFLAEPTPVGPFSVTPSGSHVAVSPGSAQTVAAGATTSFSITADGAYNLSRTVGGTCAAGSWVGTVYTTGVVAEDCTVTFAAGATAIYVSSDNTQALYKCLFNASADPDVNGTLDTCVQTLSSNAIWSPFASVGLKVNGTNRLYIADNANSMIAFAPMDADGGLGSDPAPSANAAIQFNPSPTGVTHVRVQGVDYFYVSDNIGGHVYVCTIDTFTGGFIMCTATPTSPPSWTPFATAVAEVNGVQYAYVAGGLFDNSIYQCQINVDGTLVAPCNVTPSGSPTGSWNPDHITFATVNNIQYAYVASDVQDVYQCALGSDGSFTACASASGGGISWDPRGVSFGTINGTQYAYVADIGGNVYRCTLYVTNDSANGTFQNCTITTPSSGPTPNWSPRGIHVFGVEL